MTWTKLYCEDLLEHEPEIPDASVDVTVTSPPYKTAKGWSVALMVALGKLLGRVTAPGGRVFLDFGQLRGAFERPFDSRTIVERASGLEPGQTIAWVKSVAMKGWRQPIRAILENEDLGPDAQLARIWKIVKGPALPPLVQQGHYQPLQGDKLLYYCWEPVFTFFRPPERDLAGRSIGCPYSDKSNLRRGTRGRHGDVHCIGDVWVIPQKTTGKRTKKYHSDEFPEELAERAIKVAAVPPGGVVLDPFVGGGTVVAVARRLGLDAYGVDRDPEAIATTRDRCDGVEVVSMPGHRFLSKVRPGVFLAGER